ncbi:MAG: DUF58 domain-containing protein [Archangium sp.]|nr:DUF58 domain-containing protein [Archangium sp.]
MLPSSRLWVLLCALALPTAVGGFVPHVRPLVAFADVMLLACAALDSWFARRAWIRVERTVPDRLQAGVTSRVLLRVTNSTPYTWHSLVTDEVPDAFIDAPPRLEVKVPPRSRSTVTYDVCPHRRGRFEFGALHVRVRGPLGLVWHERVTPAPLPTAVYPDMRSARRLLLANGVLDAAVVGVRRLRVDGAGSEFARLRDYAQGDSVRDVDWKATARRSRPVTRVMESERAQTVLIGIDAGRTMAAVVDGLTRLDHAVNAALLLAFAAVRNGDRVGVVVFADTVKTFVPPGVGRAQYRRIVDALYSATPHLTYVDYVALFKELSVRLTRRSLVCLFTDFVDEEQTSTLERPLRHLQRRHVPVCLSVKDTALSSLLREPPTSAEAAWQLAVASEVLTERERFKRRISQQGVTLFDVDAHSLSVTAVNAYLDVKARGRL